MSDGQTVDGSDADDEPGRSDRRLTDSSRRRFLGGAGAVTALLAGCVGGDGGDNDSTGNGGDDSENGSDDSENGNDDSENGNDDSENGNDDSENGNDDSENGNDSSENGNDSSENGNDDSENGNDDSENGDDDSENGDDDSENGGDDSENGGDDSENGESDADAFFSTLQWDQDYRLVSETTGEVDGTYEVRTHDGDRYATYGASGAESFETYTIGNLTYIVQGDNCTVYESPPSTLPDQQLNVSEPEDLEAQEPTVTQTGSDTIDGDSVTVYELTYPDGKVGTFYVLDSGYIRRVEYEESTIDFFDWGDTEPITEPDLECTEPGSGSYP